MGLVDRLFKSRIDEEVKKNLVVIEQQKNEELVKQILAVEERMVDLSERRVTEKVQELQVQWMENLEKSKRHEDDEAKTLMRDPFALMETMMYKERPMMLSYDVLRSMSEKNAIIAAIINTRVNQVASFSTPPKSRYDVGYRINLRDDEAKPTKDDEKVIKRIESFLENTGDPDLPSEERDNFDDYLRKVSRDSLCYDQSVFEVVNARNGEPSSFLAIDGSSIRLASTTAFFKHINIKPFQPEPTVGWTTRKLEELKPEDIKYVQILMGRVVTTYTEEEIGFGVRNPRTFIRQNGYGVSELEILVNTITAHLWAEEHNRRFFSQGSSPKGIIHFEGNIPQEQLTDFRRQWHAQVMGVQNSWRTPVIAAPAKLQYTNLHTSNRQMEFTNWLDYLIKVCCAVFLIDPSEIGFDFKGGAGTTQAPMFESKNEAKQKMSRDRGLKPLLRFLQTQLNKNIIFRMYKGKFELEFVGLDAKNEEQLMELKLKEGQNFKTIDEIRADFDLPPLGKEKAGDTIMNSAYLNYLNQLQMQQMNQGGGGQEGQEEDGGQDWDFGEEEEEESEPEQNKEKPEQESKSGVEPETAEEGPPGTTGKKPESKEVKKSLDFGE